MEEFDTNKIGKSLEDIEIGKQIKAKLEEKYNNKFIVKKIANRYGIGDYESEVAICRSEDENNVLFTVNYNMVKEEIVNDDFYLKKLCNELERYIAANISNDAIVRINIFGKNKLEKECSISEFSNEFPENNFLATIIIKDEISLDEIKKAFININSNYNNLFLKTLIYTISEDEFSKCTKKLEDIPEISQTFIKELSINNNYIIKIHENKIVDIK